MADQANLTIDTTPAELEGRGIKTDSVSFAQDGARATDLVSLTVVSKIAATQLTVPLTDVAAVDGSAIPSGLFIGDDIAFADLVAGNVTGRSVEIRGICDSNSVRIWDEAKIILENSLTLDSVITAATGAPKTIRDYFADKGIFFMTTINQELIQPIN